MSVGVESRGPIDSTARFELRRFGELAFAIAVVLLGGMIWGLVRLARRSSMVRDRAVAGLEELELPAGKRRPYSLARVQMMVWFVLVVGAFVLIWIVTGNVNTITNSVLGLIGIGTGTALGAAMVEAGKGMSQEEARKARESWEALEKERRRLMDEKKELGAQRDARRDARQQGRGD